MTRQSESSRPASRKREGEFAGISISRRRLFLLGGAAGMALLFPGCGGSGSASTSTGGSGSPAASPQNLIYFASSRSADGTYRIFSMNPDGSNVTDVAVFDQYEAITGTSSIETFDPSQLSSLSFSADGTSILANYTFILYPIVGDPNLNQGNGAGMLYVSLKTGASHNLLSTLGLMGPDGVLSPDGTKILYVPFYQTNGSGTEISALNIAGIDGSNPTVRYSTTTASATLFPLGFGADNATLYAYSGGTSGRSSVKTYYRLDPGSSTPVVVTTLPSSLGHPDISPTGVQILSTVYSAASKAMVVIASLDGSTQKTLTTGAANDLYPIFSHDGTKIYFVSDRDGNHEIYAMNTDGTGVTRLTYNFSDDTHPLSRKSQRPGRIRLFR